MKTFPEPTTGCLKWHERKERTVWIVSDGKAGHEAQCLGVAAALGTEPVIKRVTPKGICKLAAPWGPVAPSERFGQPGSQFAPPWPTIALATGRTTIPYLRALKRHAGLQTMTVILMDPRTRLSSAELIWVPQHDELRGPNVIATLTAPHVYSRARIDALRASLPPEIANLPRPRFAVLIGGPNAAYRYPLDDIERLKASITSLVASGAGVMVTTSRRTPSELTQALSAATAHKNCLFWNGQGKNLYPEFLAHADAFIVTADSVSMTCEAVSTGQPIYVFTPSGEGGKFARFHAALRKHGATRGLPERMTNIVSDRDTWTYEPLNSAQIIADEIVRRWEARAQMIPGLMERA